MRTPSEWAALHTIDPEDQVILAQMVEAIIEERCVIPGLYHCPKCGFQQSFNVISPKTLDVSIDPTKRDYPCPNDGSLLEPMTWKAQASCLAEALLKAHQRDQERSTYYDMLYAEITRCCVCNGLGKIDIGRRSEMTCPICSGSGRDFHGSTLAKIHWDKILQERERQQPDNTYGSQ